MVIISIMGAVVYISATIIKTALFLYAMHFIVTLAKEILYSRNHYECAKCKRVARYHSGGGRVCFDHVSDIWTPIRGSHKVNVNKLSKVIFNKLDDEPEKGTIR